MIPTHWFRRILLALLILEVGGGMLWFSAWLAPLPSDKQLYQTVGCLIFLGAFYASTPLTARFLAPIANTDPARLARLAQALAHLPDSHPVFLYDHKDQEANTLGLWPRHTRIYLTTGLLDHLSDEGLTGVLAHENAHARERHILALYAYACVFALGSHVLASSSFFFFGFLLFLAVRRYCEYRADAGAAAAVGRDAMLTGLHELAALYPPRPWQRWLSWLTAYPTLPMRMRALETGQIVLI